MKKRGMACLLAVILSVMPGTAVIAEANQTAGVMTEMARPATIMEEANQTAGVMTEMDQTVAFMAAAGNTADGARDVQNFAQEALHQEDILPERDLTPSPIPLPDGETVPGEEQPAGGEDTETFVPDNEEADVFDPDVVPDAGEDPEEAEFDGEEAELFSSGEEIFRDFDQADLFSDAAEANSSATFITYCMGYRAGQVRVNAKVPQSIKSKDNYYYLFQVNPNNDKLSRQTAKIKKPTGTNTSVTFKLNTSGHPEYVMAKYALAVKTKAGGGVSSYTRVSAAKYVSSPEKAATDTSAYALPKSKKGLQTTSIAQLTETKSKTAFINLPVSILLVNNAERVSYRYNGKTYYFNKIGGYTQLVRQCNQKGIQVTVQLLLDYTSSTRDLTAAGAKGSGAAYYAWNTTNAASRQKMEALFSFIAQLFGSSDCYVSNWILGNEVNTYRVWNYPGNMSKSKYISNYSETFRCLYNAVRGRRAGSKVFICLDHYWNLTVQGYAARDMMDSVAARLNDLESGVNWNLAYHAYPFPLNDPRFWSGNNSNYLTNNSNSPVISLNNLSVLTNYIKKNYGTRTRVILSEQGFTSTKGQDAQAAALALGYYIAACNPMVDAFHIRSYQDESHEVAQGLAMGIKGKKAFKVFVNMDSSKTLNYTNTYLKKQVGSKWSGKVPGYYKKRLYTMYRTD